MNNNNCHHVRRIVRGVRYRKKIMMAYFSYVITQIQWNHRMRTIRTKRMNAVPVYFVSIVSQNRTVVERTA